MKTIQENLKLFYLGLENKEPFLYKNKDLTTHAAIIGMTGSGKTGLGITLLEEACIDNIPSIIIDPKGDMTNLCLAFENLKEDDFLNYIDENEASSLGVSKSDMAKDLCNAWQSGLESSFQSKERIGLLKNSADFTIYTPKSSVGVSVALLGDFICPLGLSENELLEYINSLTSSIFSLLGLNLDISSREFILISYIFETEFKKQKDISIQKLIAMICEPPFAKIGAFDTDKFYPSSERFKLSIKLNSLLSSPSFRAYTNGERLDLSKMLFNSNKKAKCSIFTISHLDDNERMFFVTFLLNQIISFMRTTQGTSSLRAILYMDEIFGFFPPNANPPSKMPMLTLLKQARAFGIGCVLSTQNPVDLDYKGLSNIGTWFIGRLQTAQDKARVIDGLNTLGMDKKQLDELLSNLPKRHFVVKNINENSIRTISTRWALSYLKGPLNSEQISNLMLEKRAKFIAPKEIKSSFSSTRPIVQADIKQHFLSASGELNAYILGSAKARFYDAKLGIDTTKDINLLYELSAQDQAINWSEASIKPGIKFIKEIGDNVSFGELPRFILNLKNTNDLKKSLKEFIYRNEAIWLYSALGINSTLNESKEQFFMRLQDRANEIMEQKTDQITEKFQKERAKLQDKLIKAEYKLQKEQKDMHLSGIGAILNIGASLVGAFFGSKRGGVGKVVSGVKSASRLLKDRDDVKISEQSVNDIQSDIQALIMRFEDEIALLKSQNDITNIEIKEIKITPKRSDVFDEDIVLAWA